MKKVQTNYVTELKNSSEYDFFDIHKNEESGQIRISFLESRWRTIDETVAVLQEMIDTLKKAKI